MGDTPDANPLVSVVMPIYQAERHLAEAIESVLAQGFDDFELLAMDDGSTDGSLEILGALADRDDRIRVLEREHEGLVPVLNAGIAAARGKFIARMDADDVSHPERLERQLAWLQDHPECVAVGTGVDEVDPERRPIRTLTTFTAHEEIDARLLAGDGGALIHGSALYRTEALRTIGGYRQALEGGEDVDLHLRLAERGRLANLPDRLYEYRKKLDSLTSVRRHQMRVNQDAAIQDALARRGRDPESAPPRPPELPPVPADVTWAIWSNHAIEAGHLGTARLYAWKAFRTSPRRHWKLPIRATLGIRPHFWSRIRG